MKSIINLCSTLILFISMSIISSCTAQGQNPSSVSQKYVADYINMKFSQLPDYYTDTSIFQDPTLALIDDSASMPVQGTANIIAKLKRNFNGVKNPNYKLNSFYQVGEISIFSGVYDYTQNATAFGGPDIDINFSLKSTTIIKEKDGKILEHIDYMDYTSWFQQFETQKHGK